MKIRRNYGTVAFALAGSVLFLANTTAAIAEDFPDLESLRIFHVGGTLSSANAMILAIAPVVGSLQEQSGSIQRM